MAWYRNSFSFFFAFRHIIIYYAIFFCIGWAHHASLLTTQYPYSSTSFGVLERVLLRHNREITNAAHHSSSSSSTYEQNYSKLSTCQVITLSVHKIIIIFSFGHHTHTHMSGDDRTMVQRCTLHIVHCTCCALCILTAWTFWACTLPTHSSTAVFSCSCAYLMLHKLVRWRCFIYFFWFSCYCWLCCSCCFAIVCVLSAFLSTRQI